MSSVRRVGKYIEIEFADAEITDVYGPEDELYGHCVMVLSYREALNLAKEVLEKIMEIVDAGEGHEGAENSSVADRQ
jgi:hypothetical protein